MIDAGDPALDFDLPRPTADGEETYRLSGAARVGPVVVAFYPVADADGSVALLRELADADWSSAADRFAVLGVGVGEPADHERLAAAVDVPFPLLLDRDGYFADGYGVLEPVGDDAVRVRRAVFVVDGDCFVRGAWAEGDGEDGIPLDEITSTVASLGSR